MKPFTMTLLKRSELNLLRMIGVFIFGLSNVIPSRYSIYDQYMIPFIETNLHPDNLFFSGIKLGLLIFWLMRFLILAGTIYQGYLIYKYAERYKIFG